MHALDASTLTIEKSHFREKKKKRGLIFKSLQEVWCPKWASSVWHSYCCHKQERQSHCPASTAVAPRKMSKGDDATVAEYNPRGYTGTVSSIGTGSETLWQNPGI